MINAGRWLASMPGVFWLLPICIALLTTRYLFTNVDSGEYLIYGRMLADGRGYGSDLLGPQLGRGPLFSIIIAGIIRFFGLKLELIGYVTRAFYMLDLLILYGIGRRLYGRLAGYFVFFLALTAFTIHKTTPYILLDHVLPFFILSSVLMTILAIQTPSAIFPFAAGASLGLAYLTKESALMYLPMFCLLLFQKRYSVKKRFIRTAATYISFGLVSAPWIYHIIRNSQSLKDVLIKLMGGQVRYAAASALGQSTGTVSLLGRIASVVDSIVHYHTITVSHDFVIAPLFLVGAVLLIITLLVRKRFTGVEVLLAAIVLTSPLNAHLGTHNLRTGQSITYYYLLLAGTSSILGCFVLLLQTWKNKGTSFPGVYKTAAWGLPIILAISIIAFQLQREKGFIEALRGNGPYGLTYYQTPQMEITGTLGPAQLEAAKWISQRTGREENVLISMTLWGPMTFTGLSKKQTAYIWLHPGLTMEPEVFELARNSLPFLIINPLGNMKRLTLDFQRNLFSKYFSENDRPLFIFTLPALPGENCISADGSLHSNPQYYCGIWFFLEKMFLNFINSKHIHFIVLSQTESYFNEYLSRNDGFQLVFQDERETGSAYIYRVKNPQPLAENFLMVGDRVPVFMERLKKYYPEKYERFQQEVLIDFLNFDIDRINQILSGEGVTFKTN